MTNDIARRLVEHFENRGEQKTFAGRYSCYSLIYYETFSTPMDAILREKELKKWSRKKKDNLINSENPKWNSLNRAVGFFND